MKKHFYKIPMETIENMFNHAAGLDKVNGYDYTAFLESWLKNRHEFFITEDSGPGDENIIAVYTKARERFYTEEEAFLFTMNNREWSKAEKVELTRYASEKRIAVEDEIEERRRLPGLADPHIMKLCD